MTITIKNTTSIASQVIMSRDGTFTGRLLVDGKTEVCVPTAHSYTVIGSITMKDGNTYVSEPVHFSGDSQNITAEMLLQSDPSVLCLVQTAGTYPNGIALYNRTRYPVTFSCSVNDNPLRLVTVVDDESRGLFSTRDIYSFQAIIDGVTSASITTSNCNATVAIYAENEVASDFVGCGINFVD